MADLYPTYGRQYQRQDSSYHLQPSTTSSAIVYPPQLITSQPALADDHPSPSHDASSNSPTSASPKQDSPTAPKSDGLPSQPAKPQATFLTKLYALLERPENQHMIRWDEAGEHIIVERPEQLALHVLPSVYRQSRFASFSRQLNIYGFMRKVNLRNVDPAIDDPDASTWSHPTLNRHSAPETVANFKRRVPPRLPKPRKRDSGDSNNIPAPRSAVGMGPVSLIPAGSSSPPKRGRGFSAPGSFTPLTQPSAPGWNTSYPRSLPPLTVPTDPPMHSSSMYSHSPHTLHPITPSEDTPSSAAFSPVSYSNSSRDMILPSPSSQYSYGGHDSWSFSPTNGSSNHSNGSLSSLLNPSSSYSATSRAPTTGLNSYPSYSSVHMRTSHHNGSTTSLDPDSRPATGYSVSSMSSLPTPYEETTSHHFGHHDYSRPGSSHHHTSAGRPITPNSRPTSSKSSYPGQAPSLSIRRDRRHSHAMSPYPSPYGEHPPLSANSERPSTSPQPPSDDHMGGNGNIPRVRSMIQLPSVDTYGFNPAQADFAFHHPVDDVRHTGHGGSAHHHGGSHIYGNMSTTRSVRPSTSASSLSTSSSAANTPGVDGYGTSPGEGADINRFSPDYGFVPMNEHIPQYSKTDMQ
ncbi:HSF-type DNA-binding-domain-containing protein [Cristinia sonorae]|uniref:HSF-type DNA-binding-domain-containing protein n=1 Tax=Cristinia sonorae TaxID=1940300 RepID=A0A8K0UYQ1_9AGAR|nr:HSF-type DNA-binding-domain-containing protein [Cristinia sonorae]